MTPVRTLGSRIATNRLNMPGILEMMPWIPLSSAGRFCRSEKENQMKNFAKGLAVIAISMLLPLVMGTAAQAQTQHSLAAGSGGQLQIGSGLPLPIQVFTGGTASGTAGIFPPLLVPHDPVPIITQQTDGKITVPPNVLSKVATAIQQQPTFVTNVAVFQVNTAIDYRFPSATATFAPGGGPALPGSPYFGPGTAGGSMTYTQSGASNSFGGSAQFAINGNTALAAGGAIVGQPVTVYINFAKQFPASAATRAALVGAQASNAWAGVTTAFPGQQTPGVAAPNWSMAGSFASNGAVLGSVQCIPPACLLGSALVNNVLSDKGNPWTTGLITVAAPNAVGAPETFFLSGTDTRTDGGGNQVGSGNISMVSGTMSNRTLSGPNSNRAWVSLTLPEPTAMAGAAGALLMLGVCHNMVRRRR